MTLNGEAGWRSSESARKPGGSPRLTSPIHSSLPVCVSTGQRARRPATAAPVANSDAALLRLFVGWVRAYLEPDPDTTLALHLHEGNDEAAAWLYRAGATRLSEGRFTKTFIKPPGSGHRKNQLAHGICRVRVRHPADHWNRIMEWIDVVAENLGSQVDGVSIISSGR